MAALTEIVAGGNAAKLTAAVTVKGDGTAGGSKGAAFVGADRAKDMAVNVVLPALPLQTLTLVFSTVFRSAWFLINPLFRILLTWVCALVLMLT